MVQNKGPQQYKLKKKKIVYDKSYLDKPLGTTSLNFEPSFVGKGVEALSSMFTSFEWA